jgi:hypothetical protein
VGIQQLAQTRFRVRTGVFAHIKFPCTLPLDTMLQAKVLLAAELLTWEIIVEIRQLIRVVMSRLHASFA